jgi:hypothetical protein
VGRELGEPQRAFKAALVDGVDFVGEQRAKNCV